MLTLLLRISIPEFRRHLLRTLLTTIGILLGVAIFAAIRSANFSLRASLRDTIDQIAGKAVLQVTGPAGVPETVVDEVRLVPGVRAAVPVIEAVVHTSDLSQGNILVLGVDMTGDKSMRDYTIEGSEDSVSDPLVFLAQPDSIIVSKEFASRNNLRDGSPIKLITALGTRSFTVRGVMAPQGMAKAFGGNVGVMDILSAQFIFSRGRTFDRIDVALGPEVKIGEAISRIEASLGSGFRVEPPRRRGTQTESLMETYSRVLYASSVIALAIGLFLIFNAFAIAVTQRRVQIGILRTLGVTRAQIQLLFLNESLILGLVGSILGTLLGIVLGRSMMMLMARVVEQTYGVHVLLDRFRVDALSMFASIALGVSASLLGSYLPARAAGRVDAALALQKGKYQILFLGENRVRRLVGVLLLLACMGLRFSPWVNIRPIQLLIFIALFFALTLLVPTLCHWLARLLGRPMSWLFGMEGRLASDALIQAPRRTSATVSALMFSLAFVLVMATFSASVKASFTSWIDAAINPDLFVYASESVTTRTFQFPSAVGDELKTVPGVRQVDSARVINIEYDGKSPELESIEINQWLRRSHPLMEEGRVEDLPAGMVGSNGVLISSNFARLHNLKKGSSIVLDTATGRQKFEIVGVQVDYSSDNGLLMIDREVYKRLWKDDRVDTFDIMLEKNYDQLAVKAEIQRRLAGSRNAFVLTNKDVRAEIMRLTDQFLSLQYVQIFVAILVATIGIINSLMVSITERKREIGILRSLGGETWQVLKAIVLEAVCIGMVALVLGIVSGAILGYYSIGTFGAALNGWTFPYRFPLMTALALIPGVVLISVIAAWYPASLALKTPLVEALAYE